jgi:isopenicillin-N N-acyltransferase-like protein
MRILDLKGSAAQRGHAQGEAFGAEIRRLAEDNFTTIHENAKSKSYSYIPREMLNTLAERYIPWAREYDADLLAEMAAIGEAADLPLSEVFAVNSFLDLADLMYPYLADRLLFGCTAWGLRGAMTSTGESMIGQTYDVRIHYEPYPVVLRIQPDDGPACVVYSFTGMIGLAGMNSEGISVVINKLTPDDSGPGVPYPMIIRRILKSRHLAAAVDAVINARRASGINYIIADRNGQVINLECTAQDYDIVEFQSEGFIVHTNHYQSPRLRNLENARRRFVDESCTRWDRMSQLLRERAGNVKAADMEENMHDHGNHPKCICVHADEEEPFYKRVVTTGAVLIQPQQMEIKLLIGQPCEHRLEEVALPQL